MLEYSKLTVKIEKCQDVRLLKWNLPPNKCFSVTKESFEIFTYCFHKPLEVSKASRIESVLLAQEIEVYDFIKS